VVFRAERVETRTVKSLNLETLCPIEVTYIQKNTASEMRRQCLFAAEAAATVVDRNLKRSLSRSTNQVDIYLTLFSTLKMDDERIGLNRHFARNQSSKPPMIAQRLASTRVTDYGVRGRVRVFCDRCFKTIFIDTHLESRAVHELHSDRTDCKHFCNTPSFWLCTMKAADSFRREQGAV
jgi:hypothetical protein